ncbi:S9 family peptidase [Streptomyces montanisoli]|uniref:Prolyl oligopeptidase family serine peptidase n=1 Tax=Streptomyces montanisoli TaxID=2798581 RepID=A0A940RTA7_9ACTN|nr:prolyl oligopeptidase family serine peptidase [Streptomyces montanisoli]MBP0456652.1 prolyl oligopeptidase family serine peptidase [Streptomyces montanisoli]
MPTSDLPRQFTRTRRYTLGAPARFTVAPDGDAVLFVRSRAGDDPVGCLWVLDVATGEERLLADPAELLGGAADEVPEEERVRRERARQQAAGITDYATDTATRLAVFALSGRLWVVETGSGALRELPARQPVVDPRPSPDGRHVAYVSGGALRVIGADGGGDRTVATPDPAEGPDVFFGLPEHAASESMGRHRAYWWAPDGDRLLATRVDNREVQLRYLSEPADPAKPPRAMRYPQVGTANAEVTLWIADLAGKRQQVRWDRDAFEYVPVAGWDEHGPFAAVLSRDQRTLKVLAVDPVDGTTRLLAERQDERWVELLVPGVPARMATGLLVDTLDRGATRHLSVGGAPVTPDGLQLHEVLAVDGETVFFVAAEEPTERHLWSYRPEQGVRRLTEQPGVHSGVFGGGTLVHTARTPDLPGSRTSVHRQAAGHNGRPRADYTAAAPVEIVSHAQRPLLELRVESAAVGPRALRTHLFLPSWHRPGDAPLPVLLDPYGGPALQKVLAEQSGHDFVSQWFAEQGFAVLVADGAGTPGRGPRWEKEIHGDLVGPALADQVAALHATAERRPELDLGRVAIRGWSFSGTLAAAAVLRRPDVFHAAVAGAPVTDQRLYDACWKERYLGSPDRYPEHYETSSLLADAPKLRRPLLLVHGLADDNVFVAGTLRLSAALLAAGKPHEVLPLSGTTHAASAGDTFARMLEHQLEFLLRNLDAGSTR